MLAYLPINQPIKLYVDLYLLQDMRCAPFFENFDWAALLQKQMPTPFLAPNSIHDLFDASTFVPLIDEADSGPAILAEPAPVLDGSRKNAIFESAFLSC